MAFEQTEGILDWGHLPTNYHCDVQEFNSGNNGQGQNKWLKPRGVSMCYMLAISGGGAGGAGFSGASTTARGGGGGGACSGLVSVIRPALFLPNALTIVVGSGGKGGTGAGGNGTNSFIGYGDGKVSVNGIPNIIMESGGNAPGGGGAGTIAAGGAAGAVPTISTLARIAHSAYFGTTYNFGVGLVGIIGGAQTGVAGGAIANVWNLIPLSPGASGAGVNTVSTGFAGGAITLQNHLDFCDGIFMNTSIAGGLAGSAAAAGHGNAGIQSYKPFLMTGGSGGGSSDGAAGGNGGNGGIGCGGGGGGGGVTGGLGGNGGDGLVVIISW